MDYGWQMSTMERKVLIMSRESENIVRQWEEQKQMEKQNSQLEKLILKVVKSPVQNKNPQFKIKNHHRKKRNDSTHCTSLF